MIKHLPHDISYVNYKYGITARYDPNRFHRGVDIKAKVPGTPGDKIYSCDDGKVVISRNDVNGYGNYVVVDHGTYCTLYAHMTRASVKVGATVKAGQILGYMGNTGHSSGVHLHFEIRSGKYVASTFFNKAYVGGPHANGCDPEPYIDEYIKAHSIPTQEEKDLAHWAYPTWVALNKIITVTDMRFDHTITRGEVFALLDRVVVKANKAKVNDIVKDKNGHWASGSYNDLNQRGIYISETRYDDPITRAEMIVMLDRLCLAMKAYDADIIGDKNYSNTHWAEASFDRLNAGGVKVADKNYSNKLTRGEMMAFILRLVQKLGL